MFKIPCRNVRDFLYICYMERIKEILELEKNKANARELAKLLLEHAGIETNNCLCTPHQRLQLWKVAQKWIDEKE